MLGVLSLSDDLHDGILGALASKIKTNFLEMTAKFKTGFELIQVHFNLEK